MISRRRLLLACCVLTAALAAGSGCAQGPKPLRNARSVVILGIDGMDPKLLEAFMAKGRMPYFEKLMREGSYTTLTTSTPPQSPVAWSNFITGMNPGGHGIFDFIHCDHTNYMPMFSAALVEEPKRTVTVGRYVVPLSAGRVELLRRGDAFWQILDKKEIPYLIYKIPSNFPPVKCDGFSLSGMGTPDLLGTYGTFSFYTDDPSFAAMDVSGGQVIPVTVESNRIHAALIGPTNTLLKENPDLQRPFVVSLDVENGTAAIKIDDMTIVLEEGEWTDWFEVRFDVLGPLKKISGITRFYLKSLSPHFMLYAAPININPADPALPLSTPADYAKRLYRRIGLYGTKGMPEDTKALEWGVFDDGEFIEQADFVLGESIRALDDILRGYTGGLLFYYFSTLDQTTHMLWRDFDPDHPAHTADSGPYLRQTEEYYAKLDSIVGAVQRRIPKDAVFIAMSDHGFAPFYWKFNLNTWLYENGYISVMDPSDITGHPLFRNVFWRRSRAFGLGINGLYINVRGRDAEGVVKPGEEYDALVNEIRAKLLAYRDPANGRPVVKEVYRREDVYQGEEAKNAPDLIVGYYRGYRCSDESALGEFTSEIISPNLSKWTGDHCMATDEVPGIIASNRKLLVEDPALTDIAATVLHLYGIEPPKNMIGRRIFE
ncbi:MAG: alkaline phosphatase family protein [Ignavibacteriaceae bacterium]|nr:alkaline phosphatase family protein [Ignavibacteriaceae bacterium]